VFVLLQPDAGLLVGEPGLFQAVKTTWGQGALRGAAGIRPKGCANPLPQQLARRRRWPGKRILVPTDNDPMSW